MSYDPDVIIPTAVLGPIPIKTLVDYANMTKEHYITEKCDLNIEMHLCRKT